MRQGDVSKFQMRWTRKVADWRTRFRAPSCAIRGRAGINNWGALASASRDSDSRAGRERLARELYISGLSSGPSNYLESYPTRYKSPPAPPIAQYRTKATFSRDVPHQRERPHLSPLELSGTRDSYSLPRHIALSQHRPTLFLDKLLRNTLSSSAYCIHTATMSEHTYKFNVAMSCGGCSGAIDRVLKKLEG